MTPTRPPRRTWALGRAWAVRVVAAAAAVAMLGLAATPARAAQLDDERSPKVKVSGTKLAPSDLEGTADDPAIGKTAPTLKGLSLSGKKVKFKNDGEPRILVFLAHWCPHCQAEVPRIVKLDEQGALDGVEIDTIATNTSKRLPNWPPSEWLSSEDWPFRPVMADDSKSRAFLGYGGQGFPYLVFVDADGKVAARFSGEIEPDTLAGYAQRLAAGQSPFE